MHRKNLVESKGNTQKVDTYIANSFFVDFNQGFTVTMSKPFDYSKWDNIELSDDEDDVHPNIDRESWFRMKHRSRVEREEREEEDKKKLRAEMAEAEFRIKEIKKMLAEAANDAEDDSDDDDDLEDTEGLKAELKELENTNAQRQKKLDDYEKNKKWNVDNMCRVVEERTVLTKSSKGEKFSKSGYALPDDDEDDDGKIKASSTKSPAKIETTEAKQVVKKPVEKAVSPKSTAPKSSAESKEKKSSSSGALTTKSEPKKETVGPTIESVAMLSYYEFTEKYTDKIEHFMTLHSLSKSKEYLLHNGNILLQENASNYLLLASLEDEMNGFHDKMKLTARQSQIISNIAELAKTMQRHPGSVIVPFFKRMEQKEFLAGFMQGVNAFIEKVQARAIVKKKEIDAEREAELAASQEEGEDLANIPVEERLGPGGLDPVEVFESLPESMQRAFEQRDTDMLKDALLKMDIKDAERHMKRCSDSGLWNEG